MMKQKLYKSPAGKLLLQEQENCLVGLYFVDDDYQADEQDSPLFEKVIKQLEEYFAGQRKDFDLPLGLEGTAFQLKAWQALQKIPCGQTRTYGEQAELLGGKNFARAVGGANGKNPISIIVPCHRVLGSNGLGGYASGLKRKQWLLEHEASMEY